MTSDTRDSESQAKPKDAFAFVAARALKEIVHKRSAAATDRVTIATYFAEMMFSDDYVGDDAVAEVLADEGVSPEYLLDELIPEIAQKSGRDWQMDRMSFATVTVLTARLQSLAWKYIDPYRDAADMKHGARRVLVATPENETHTLGAVLAIGGFARRGCQVKVAFGMPHAEVIEAVRTGGFDLIALSAAPSSDLATLTDLIVKIRRDRNAPPIAVGGSLIAVDPGSARSLGADIATCDAAAALDMLNVKNNSTASKPKRQDVRLRANGNEVVERR